MHSYFYPIKEGTQNAETKHLHILQGICTQAFIPVSVLSLNPERVRTEGCLGVSYLST